MTTLMLSSFSTSMFARRSRYAMLLASIQAFALSGCVMVSESADVDADADEEVETTEQALTAPTSQEQSALAAGSMVTSSAACDSTPGSDGAEQLAQFGITNDRGNSCEVNMREVTTGVTLATPPAGAGWNGIGGAGKLSAEALLCLLRGLQDKPIVRPISLGKYGNGLLEMRILDFNPTTRTVRGYRRVTMKVPLLGTISSRPQVFQASIVATPLLAPPFGIQPRAGDIPISSSYALRIAAEDEQRGFDVDPPQLSVMTPYGTVTAAPHFSFDSRSQVVGAPTFTATQSFMSKEVVNAFSGSKLYDVAGRQPGLAFADNAKADGWWSFLALGGRGEGAIWNGQGNRPDLDLTMPRWNGEAMPNMQASSSLALSLDLAGLLPLPLRSAPVDASFTFSITPKVESSLWTQTQISAGESQAPFVDTWDLTGTNWGRDRVKTSIDGKSEFSVTGGLHAHIVINFLFGSVELLDIDEEIPLFNDTKPASSVSTSAEYGWTGSLTPHQNLDANATMVDVGGASVSSPSSYVAACLAKPATTGSLPPATYTPGTAEELVALTPLPCNLCIATASASGIVGIAGNPLKFVYGTVPAVTSVLAPADTPPSWTCEPAHSGCYDLCMDSVDAMGVHHRTKVKSAQQIKAQCGDIIQ